MGNLKEVQYEKIFSPETMALLKGKSGESLRQMIGNKNVMQVLSRTMRLLPEISEAESEYIDELEPLSIQMVKDAYPIIDYAGIEIDAKITDMSEVLDLINKDKEEKTMIKSMEFVNPVEDIPDDKKRRIINGITQGASVRGAFWFLIFREYLDSINPELIEKYKEIMNLSLGAYDDENFIALLLASLARGGAEEGGAGGASMVEVMRPIDDDEDDEEGGEENEEPVLKITAKALNFPMLVYEIVKGLYEIVSLQGFGANKEKNKQVVKRIDQLSNEPDDLRYGKFIFDAISNLYNESNFDDPRIRELLFTEIYKLDDDNFFPFIENAINGRLTSQQKKWVTDVMKEIERDLKKDDSGLEDLDEKKTISLSELKKKVMKQQILREYSEKVYKTLIDRYKKQNANLDDDNLRYYISRFHQLLPSIQQRFNVGDEGIKSSIPKDLQTPDKNGKITKYTDILQWRFFKDLEKIVDLFPASKSFKKAALVQNMAETDADEIFNEDGIEIYKGDTMHRCVKYGKSETYSWCISRAGDTRSMYYSYRFQEKTSRMFYFVFDKNRSSRKTSLGHSEKFQDPWHAFVIHVYEKGDYAITDADNSGDKTAGNWNDISSIVPKDIWIKIKNLKSLFKYISPSEEETELQMTKGKKLSKEQFLQLSYRLKTTYVINNAKTLPSEIFNVLDTEMKNMTINYGRRCSYDELKSNIGLLKRYPDYMATRETDKPIPYEFIPYLKPELQYEYFKRFEEEYLTFDEIEKYFDKSILDGYIKHQIDKFGFLPKEATKYMTPEQEKIWNIYSVSSEDVSYYGNQVNNETIAPQRTGIITDLSYKTFDSIEPKRRIKFIEFLKNLGKNISNIERNKYFEFFVGVPTCILVKNKLYFITPIQKESDKYCIITQEGKKISKDYESITIYKGSKEIPENDVLARPVGVQTFWITETEFTSVKGDGVEILNLSSFK